ncbi:hypothetical protein F5Y18DRAFT_424010 [Xylariaceae sp. FL1019]|nr:hypothetical protein F5Y18DRAFT_424010 [Xylariaceae sp. FL1019]
MADKTVLGEANDAVQDAGSETSEDPKLNLLPELRIIIYRQLIQAHIAEYGSTNPYYHAKSAKSIYAVWNNHKSRNVFWAPSISPVDTLSQEELQVEFYGKHSFSIMIWSGWWYVQESPHERYYPILNNDANCFGNEGGGKDAFEHMCIALRPQMEQIKKFTFMTGGKFECTSHGKCGDTMIGFTWDSDQPMSVHRRIGSDSTNWTSRQEICKELVDVAHDSLTHKRQAFERLDFRILVDILCQLGQLGLCSNRQFGFIFQEEIGCNEDNRVDISGLDPYTDYGPNNTEFGEEGYGYDEDEDEDPENLRDHSATDPPDDFSREEAGSCVS